MSKLFDLQSGQGSVSGERRVLQHLFPGEDRMHTTRVTALGLLLEEQVPYGRLISLVASCHDWEIARDISAATMEREEYTRKGLWLAHLNHYLTVQKPIKMSAKGMLGLAIGIFQHYDSYLPEEGYDALLPITASLIIGFNFEEAKAECAGASYLSGWHVNQEINDQYRSALSSTIKEYFRAGTSQRLKVAAEILRRSQVLLGTHQWAFSKLGDLMLNEITYTLVGALSSARKANAVLHVIDECIVQMEAKEAKIIADRKRSEAAAKARGPEW